MVIVQLSCYILVSLTFTHFVHLLTGILSCSHDIVLYDKDMDKVLIQTLHSMYTHSFGAPIELLTNMEGKGEGSLRLKTSVIGDSKREHVH